MHNLKLWNASNKKNNLSQFTDKIKNNLKFNTYLDLHKWSIENKSDFWRQVWKFTKIKGDLKGEIYIQEHQVTYQKMVPKLLAIAKNRTDTRIYVRGDKNINYGRVLEVMGTLSGAGFSKVALISEPYKN